MYLLTLIIMYPLNEDSSINRAQCYFVNDKHQCYGRQNKHLQAVVMLVSSPDPMCAHAEKGMRTHVGYGDKSMIMPSPDPMYAHAEKGMRTHVGYGDESMIIPSPDPMYAHAEKGMRAHIGSGDESMIMQASQQKEQVLVLIPHFIMMWKKLSKKHDQNPE